MDKLTEEQLRNNTDTLVSGLIQNEYELATKHRNAFVDNNHAYGVLMEEMFEAKEDAKIIKYQCEDLLEHIKSNDIDGLNIALDVTLDSANNLIQEVTQIAAVCKKWKEFIKR